MWGRQVAEMDPVPPFCSDKWCRTACSHPHSQTKENSPLLDTAVKGIKCGGVHQKAPTGSHRAPIHHYLFARCCQCESPLRGRQRGEDSILREDSGGEHKKEEWKRQGTKWTPQPVNRACSSSDILKWEILLKDLLQQKYEINSYRIDRSSYQSTIINWSSIPILHTNLSENN